MRRHHGVASLAGLVLAVPVATWWLVGDRSEPAGYQRIIEPPSLSERSAEALAALTVAVLLASGITAMAAWREGQLDGADCRATVPLLIAGVLAAVGGRVLTSATYGANIGGGLVLMAAPFVLLPLLVAGLRGWLRILRPRTGVRIGRGWPRSDASSG